MKVLRSSYFSKWLSALKDAQAKARINARILQIQHYGKLLGDWKSLGEGLYELRFHFGPGYRVYLAFEGSLLLLLLAGGTKTSQARDIKRARAIERDWRKHHES